MSTGADYDPATQPKRPDRTLGELVAEMTSELSTLFRQEIELAKTEARDDARNVGRAGGLLGAGVVAAWLAVLMLSFALAWLLDQAMNTALAFAIVGVAWAIVALVVVSAGRDRLKAVRAMPQTRKSLKEDVEWARAQTS